LYNELTLWFVFQIEVQLSAEALRSPNIPLELSALVDKRNAMPASVIASQDQGAARNIHARTVE
jgi:hypothetical protein